MTKARNESCCKPAPDKGPNVSGGGERSAVSGGGKRSQLEGSNSGRGD